MGKKIIKSKDDLIEIFSFGDYQGNLIFKDDINLKDESLPVLTSFSGVIEGNGHTIKNISRNIERSIKYTDGLLVTGNRGVIRNLNIKNININNDWKVGGIAGKNRGEIENCSVTGKINARNKAAGIVCKNNSRGTVNNCDFSGSIITQYKSGGVVGTNLGLIKESHSDIKINRKTKKGGKLGGIASENTGYIRDSYVKVNTIEKLNTNEIGMVVGDNRSGEIRNCYWIGEKEDNSRAVLISQGIQKDVKKVNTLGEANRSIVAGKI